MVPVNYLTGMLEPQFISLVAVPSNEQSMTEVAALFVDPVDKLKRCKLLIKPFENDLRITLAALRDGTSSRTLSGGWTVDLRAAIPPRLSND